MSTAGYSIITIEFPTKKETYIGYCQAAVGIGLMMGPVLGQALYAQFQYEKTFYIFAAMLALAMVALAFIIPNSLNHADDIMSKEEVDQYFERLRSTHSARSSDYIRSSSHHQRPLMPLRGSDIKTTLSRDVTYKMFLRNRRAMMAVVSAMFAMVFMLFFDGILTMHLILEMDIPENQAGYFFGLICATYALSSPFMGCLTTLIPRHFLTFGAFLLASVALLMFGPSQMLGFPDTIYISAAGLGILGCSCSVIFVPLLSEIIEGVREQEGIRDSGTINDKAAGVFNTAYAIGCIVAPIMGGYLSMLTNFRTTCDIMAICSASYALIFFAVIILPPCFRKRSSAE